MKAVGPSVIGRCATMIVASGLLPSTGLAHHNTEAMIAEFTAQIDTGEATAELYYRRATEYRVLRRPEEAEAETQSEP